MSHSRNLACTLFQDGMAVTTVSQMGSCVLKCVVAMFRGSTVVVVVLLATSISANDATGTSLCAWHESTC